MQCISSLEMHCISVFVRPACMCLAASMMPEFETQTRACLMRHLGREK